MAQISVSEQEIASWAPKINSIMDWFGELQRVNVSGVPPAVHVSEQSHGMRPDVPQTFEHRLEMLRQAPSVERSYVRVPKVATAADNDVSAAQPAPAAAEPAAEEPPASAAAGAGATAAAPAAAAPTTCQSVADAAAATPSSSSAQAQGAAGLPAAELQQVQAIDLRVGRITSCKQHPDAENLYVETIDVGEAEPRTIVSGLAKYVPLEQMQGRLVVVVANLKARNMRGIKSHGMLLAASDEPKTRVEPLVPPEGSEVGERIWFGDYKEQAAPAAANAVEKKKVWDAVQPGLSTGGACEALFKGLEMRTSAGVVKSPLANARVS